MSDLFYEVVFDVYLFIPYFIVQHSGTHNFKKMLIMQHVWRILSTEQYDSNGWEIFHGIIPIRRLLYWGKWTSDTHWKWCCFEVNIPLFLLLVFESPELRSILRSQTILLENCYHFHPLTFVNCECGFLWCITKTQFRSKHTEACLSLQLLLIVLDFKFMFVKIASSN